MDNFELCQSSCENKVQEGEKNVINEEFSELQIAEILNKQDSRKVTDFEANKLEKEAKKNWDIFYKRNESRFFKDRHWTLLEFQELLEKSGEDNITLLEVGCGVGNFIFPILKELPNLKIYACDFSPRAIDFVKSNPEYKEDRIEAFVADIITENCFTTCQSHNNLCDINFVSMIFVLSAISPDNHHSAIQNISNVTKSNGIIFFRDYGKYDMAQLRFKGGKIRDNFYVRRDGTRAYYFTPEEVEDLFVKNGFRKIQCEFIRKRTVNIKEKIDVGRIFVQGKFIKL